MRTQGKNTTSDCTTLQQTDAKQKNSIANTPRQGEPVGTSTGTGDTPGAEAPISETTRYQPTRAAPGPRSRGANLVDTAIAPVH